MKASMNKSVSKAEQTSAGLAIALVITGVMFLILVIYIASNPPFPPFLFSLKSKITSVQIVDNNNKVIEQGGINIVNSPPKASNILKLELDIRDFGKENRNASLIYLSPIQSPFRFVVDGEVVLTKGNFEKSIPPKSLDITIPLRLFNNNNLVKLEIKLISLSGGHLAFIDRSGFGSTSILSMVRLAKSLLTNIGNLTLCVVFLSFALVFIMAWVNLGHPKDILYLIIATLAQSWIAMWFSRFAYEVSFNVGILHKISFAIYYLFFVSYTYFVSLNINSKSKKLFLKGIIIYGLIVFIILIVTGFSSSLAVSLTIYKYTLIPVAICYFLFSILLSPNIINSKKNLSLIYLIIPLSTWIIAIGHSNDIVRIFYQNILPYNVGPYSYFLASNLFIVSIAHSVYNKYRFAMLHERDFAIARLTQHMSHDLRKPLSSIKIILDSFDSFKNNPSRLEQAKTDVYQSINNIQGMLADVLNFSREVKLETTSKSLGPVFDFVIRQIAQGFPKVYINFDYDFSAINKTLIDESRFGRVLENIIGNGIEAITIIGKKNTGTIDITTKDIIGNINFVEIIIGNDGPLFPEGVEKDLFESFFTSGKSGGTGLGLASAKKIVTLHDGEIFARNKADENGVEFVIRLPSSNEPEDFDEEVLPANSKEIFAPEVDEDGITALINKLKGKQETYKVVLLDDEALYRAGVRNVIDQNPTLKGLITLYETSNVDEALKIVEQEQPEFCIVDIDLNDSKNGYDFLTAIKGRSGLKSIVHSNRTLEEDKNKASDLGAVNLIPKPLPLVSLVEFLSGEKVEIKETKPIKLKEKVILACDDTSIVRYHYEDLFNAWLKENPGAFTYEIFVNGEELLERAKESNPTIVFTDLNMREAGGSLDGYEVIKEMRKVSRKAKTYLVSNEPLSLSEEPTKEAGGTGALEQPLSKDIIFSLLDKWINKKS